MEKAAYRKFIEGIESIPSLPVVVQQIIYHLENPKVTPNEINNLIQQDQAMLVKILKLVNSAFYGFSGKISTVTQSIMILGFNTIKSIALSTSVFDKFNFDSSDFFDKNTFWQHSIAVGVCGRMIAQHMKLKNEPEEIFVCGILHDLGKLLIIELSKDTYFEVIKKVRENNYSFFEAEEAVLGFNHAHIGAQLANHWKLPMCIKSAIQYHHSTEQAKDFHLYSSIIHTADVIVYSQKIGFNDIKSPKLSEAAWKATGLTKENLFDIIKNLPKELKKAEIFSLLANK